MRIMTLVCVLILAASACGSVVTTPPDASNKCVLGASELGHCMLGLEP